MAELAQVLRHVPAGGGPDILVDAATRDDAAVYRLSEDRALVATVDFFAPVVDDAATWGRIAAANALSDVYAMGATPRFALSLVAWPRDQVPLDILGEVLVGMAEIAGRAGCPILGGHSIDVLEPHVGLAVIGEAHPARILTNAQARPGDLLVLTKPLGTGVLSTALKRGLLSEQEIGEAIAGMIALNDGAMRAALAQGVRAATDVTGFGLIGHLGNVLEHSHVGARLWASRVPLYPRAREFAEADVVPGGTRRNLAAAESVRWATGVSVAERLLLADAQTSGGLLLAVPTDRREALIASLDREATPARAVIGEITDAPGLLEILAGD
jgi:selenide,water dikinase